LDTLLGFKNGTDGSVSVAVDAMRAASSPHAFMGVTDQGLAAIVRTKGNQDVHVILRGGTKGPNYKAEFVQAAASSLRKARPEFQPSIMVDASRTYLNISSYEILDVDFICAQMEIPQKITTISRSF
jgi:3-deoxy-7-phosphoheptulonate synthase